VDSLLGQDYSNLELVISDNASTDNTRAICEESCARDTRVRYYRNPINIGAPSNFNKVFGYTTGEYFIWAGHDDHRKPNYISVCVKALEKSDKIVLAGTYCDCVDVQGNLILVDESMSTVGMDAFHRFMRYKRSLHEYSRHRGGIVYGVYRRSALQKVMPMQNAMTADQNMILELSLIGEFDTVPERLLTRRMGGPSNSNNSLKNLASSYGITNPFLIYGAYITREYAIDGILANSKLGIPQKAQLMVWSLFHTFTAVSARVLSLFWYRIRGAQ